MFIMTRPLRRIHRIAWIVLCLILPVLLILSLVWRPVPRGNPELQWEQLP